MKETQILEAAHRAWMRMDTLRSRRTRQRRYTYGDQWGDPVPDRKRRRMITEGERVAQDGRAPLTNNLIRRLVKSVVGRFRQETLRGAAGDGTDPNAGVDPTVRRLNRLDELDARTLEEFLISGMAIHYVSAERRPGGAGVWVDTVSPERFFVNALSDPRCNDMEIAGRLLDMSLAEVVMRFSRGDGARARELRRLYSGIAGEPPAEISTGFAPAPASFFTAPEGRCRVIEVWTLECRSLLQVHDYADATYRLVPLSDEPLVAKEATRRRRRHQPPLHTAPLMRTAWHGRFLAPDGTLLSECESPFPGGEPPFVVKFYPLIDGEVHSLVEDVIDQQRYVNRLITLMDHMMGTAAKGVLLYPISCKPRGMMWADIQERWADPGGIIPYNHQVNGAMPQQIVTPMTDIGARDMLQTQIKLFEDVSGVGQALMGKSISAAVGADRYESEIRNAAASISDLTETFRDFLATRNARVSALLPVNKF